MTMKSLDSLDPAGKPWNEAALRALGAVMISVDSDGAVSVSPDIDLSGYLAEVAALADARLVSALLPAAVAACEFVSKQVAPDAPHLTAFQNGFSAVMAGGGVAPSVEPMKSAFADQAAVYGKTPDQFATLVLALGAISIKLSVALSTLDGAVKAAKAAADFAAARDAFEASVAALVPSIAQSGVPIEAPPSIVLPDLDA